MKKALTLILIATALIINSCAEEGCTDPTSLNYSTTAEKDDGTCVYLSDKIVGEWETTSLFFDEEDFIALGLFSSFDWEFQEDGDLRYNATSSTANYNATGTWTVDDGFLEITLAGNSNTLCSDFEHRFEVDLDGDDEMTIEDECNDGTRLKIVLDRD